MNEQKKLCGIFGYKREYNGNHRFYIACKKCAAKRIAQFYQAHREKAIAKSKLCQQKKKAKLARSRKTVNSFRNDIEKPNKKVEDLTKAF